MARLTASLVWVAVLLFLGVVVTPGNGDLIGDLIGQAKANQQLNDFLVYSFRRWRIISKLDPSLSLTARNGTVVLAKTNISDPLQGWIREDRSIGNLGADDGCRKPFALVNYIPGSFSAQAIVPSTNPLAPVELAPYNPFQCVPLSTLWTKKNTTTVDDFSAITMFRDESRGFNALDGRGIEGTLIGVRPTDGVNPNVQFKFVGFYSRP